MSGKRATNAPNGSGRVATPGPTRRARLPVRVLTVLCITLLALCGLGTGAPARAETPPISAPAEQPGEGPVDPVDAAPRFGLRPGAREQVRQPDTARAVRPSAPRTTALRPRVAFPLPAVPPALRCVVLRC
ncbi:hypothetical protein [Streptomyces sp. NPDC006879]|uniref:hypothetical protein n=1 Tax=Streptomyces sp. NPDC006879 TaxID=3364767 RepID=UPI0036C6C701